MTTNDHMTADESRTLAIHAAALEFRDLKNRLTDAARQMRITQGPAGLIHDAEKTAADLNVMEDCAWRLVEVAK